VVRDEQVLALLREDQQRMNIRAKVRLVATDAVQGPALMGVWRPRILIGQHLLKTLSPDQLRFVLMHELAHLKRRDIAVNWLLIALTAMHWFNPLIWLAFARLRNDREPVRDAMVLGHSENATKNDYGQTILYVLENLVRPAPNPVLAGICESPSQMKHRIRQITKFGQRQRLGTIVGAAALFLLAAVGLTDAAEPDSNALHWSTNQTKHGTVSVFGDVKRPGEYAIPPDGLTLKQLIYSVGGLADGAEDAFVRVRRSENKQKVVALEGTWQQIQEAEPIALAANDLVSVSGRTNKALAEGAEHPTLLPHHMDLIKTVVDAQFEATPLEQVIETLRNQSGVPIYVNWERFATVGVQRDQPISLQLRSIPIQQAVRLVFQQVANDAKGLDQPVIRMIEDVLTVSTLRDLRDTTDIRIYDIRDLLGGGSFFDSRWAIAPVARAVGQHVGRPHP